MFSEVEKFFYDTIKNEKLSKKAQEHKQLIVDRLTKIFEENPDLKIQAQETGKGIFTYTVLTDFKNATLALSILPLRIQDFLSKKYLLN